MLAAIYLHILQVLRNNRIGVNHISKMRVQVGHGIFMDLFRLHELSICIHDFKSGGRIPNNESANIQIARISRRRVDALACRKSDKHDCGYSVMMNHPFEICFDEGAEFRLFDDWFFGARLKPFHKFNPRRLPVKQGTIFIGNMFDVQNRPLPHSPVWPVL